MMAAQEITAQFVMDAIQKMEPKKEKLILLVGKPGSGKSRVLRELAQQKGYRYVECQELFTDELMEMLPGQRTKKAAEEMARALGRFGADVILLDGIADLYAPMLGLEPLDLVRTLSEEQKIIAAWPGLYEENQLRFEHQPGVKDKIYSAEGLEFIEIS